MFVTFMNQVRTGLSFQATHGELLSPRLLTLTWRRRTFLVCGPYGPTRSRALFWCLHFWTVASFLMYFARSSLWLWRDFKLISYTVYITWTMREKKNKQNMYNKKTSSCSRRLSRFACYYEKKKMNIRKKEPAPIRLNCLDLYTPSLQYTARHGWVG